MKSEDPFSGCHPVVNFVYFGLVLAFTMCLMHPVSLAVSLGGAVVYSVCLKGWKALGLQLRWLLPVALLTAVVNPMFNHRGMTVLGTFPSGNLLTLESIVYGLAAAGMLAAVILWFSCCTAVMTMDKFLYLFGRAIPALSLVLSMTLRGIPRCKARFQAVREAQRDLGRDISAGSVRQRVQTAGALLSIVVTWTLDDALETADSMKSRGYGLPGRTAFSVYRMDGRDRLALVWLGFCGVWLLFGVWAGGMAWHYYPTMGGVAAAPFSVSIQLVYLALCLTPAALRYKDRLAWAKRRREEGAL